MLRMMAALVVLALASAKAAMAAGPAIAVSVGLACPRAEEIELALDARLSPADRARAAGSTATVAAGAGGIQVQLRSADGQLQLERLLPVGSTCAGAGEAVAIVIERRLRELGSPPSISLPEPVLSPRPGSRPTVTLVAGIAAWWRDGVRPAAGLGVRWRPLAGPIELQAATLGPGATRSTTLTDPAAPANATLTVQATAWPVLLGAGWCVNGTRLAICGGPDLLVTVDIGRGEGLGAGRGHTRTTWSAGVGVAASVALNRSFVVLLALAGLADFTHGRFWVESDAGAVEVLRPPRWQWLGTVGLGWQP